MRLFQIKFCVFPAQAGVILLLALFECGEIRIPRASGGDPIPRI